VLLGSSGDAYTQAHELAKAEDAYRKAVELDPSELSHQRGLGQTLLAEENIRSAEGYQKLSDVIPDDSDWYLRIAQIYRELHQLDKAEENLVKRGSTHPEAWKSCTTRPCCTRPGALTRMPSAFCRTAVTGIKGQSTAVPSRRRSLAILYQQLGQLYRGYCRIFKRRFIPSKN